METCSQGGCNEGTHGDGGMSAQVVPDEHDRPGRATGTRTHRERPGKRILGAVHPQRENRVHRPDTEIFNEQHARKALHDYERHFSISTVHIRACTGTRSTTTCPRRRDQRVLPGRVTCLTKPRVPNPAHSLARYIDSVVIPLRPGNLLIRSERVLDFPPKKLRTWDTIVSPIPEMHDYPQYKNDDPVRWRVPLLRSRHRPGRRRRSLRLISPTNSWHRSGDLAPVHAIEELVTRRSLPQLDSDARAATVDALTALIRERYVLPELVDKLADRLRSGLADGRYDLPDPVAFADAIGVDLRDAAQDRHLNLRADPAAYAAALNRIDDDDDAPTDPDPIVRINHGLVGQRVLEGNVRYLQITDFDWIPDQTGAVYDAAARFLRDGDAIVIDLRRNPGESRAVQYLLSHFVPPDVLIMSSRSGANPTGSPGRWPTSPAGEAHPPRRCTC